MADTEPGLFGTWRQMRRERKARQAMTAQVPDEIAAEISDLNGQHEFTQEPEVSTVSVCVCGQWPDHPCHLPEPPGSPLPGQPGYHESVREDDGEAAEPVAAPPSAVLGYLVAYTYRADGGVEGVTHTTAMDLETARREARQYGVSPVRRWFPVELRRVDGD